VPSLDVLKEYIQKHEQKYRTLDDQFAYIQTSFESLGKSNKTNMPKLQLFEKQVGVKSMFEDMLGEISRQNLITIKFFGTNTFETQILSSTTLQSYSSAFFTQLQRQSITLQSYLADGSLTMEHITYLESIKSLDNLPAGNNAINIFII
jgi:hypothetical protein